MPTPPFFNESLLPTERDQVRTFYGLKGYADEGLSKPIEQGAVLKGYEGADDEEYKRQAFAKAKKLVPPTATPEELKQAYLAEYEKFKGLGSVEIEARRGALQDSGKAGAFESPGTILPTQAQLGAIQKGELWAETREQVLADMWREGAIPWEHTSTYATRAQDPAVEKEIEDRVSYKLHGAPDKNEGSWLGSVVNAIGAPARAVSSGIGGAVESLANRTPAPKAEELTPSSAPPSTLQALFDPKYSFAGTAYRAATGKNLDLSGRVAGLDPQAVGMELKQEASPMGGLKGAAMGALLPPPLGFAAAAALGVAGMFPETAEAVRTSAVQGGGGPDSSMYTLDYQLEKQKARYGKAAFEQAKKDVPPEASPEDLKARYEYLLNEFVRQDAASPALNNPNAARFATELVADPLNLVPGASLLKGAKKGLGAAAKAIPAGTKGGEAVTLLDRLRTGFQYAPEYGNLSEKLPESASLGRLAAEQADISVDKAMGEFDKPLSVMRKLKPEDRNTLFDLLEQRASLEPREQLFHGGPEDITTFDPTKLQKNDYGYYGPGFYTTNSAKTATKYADMVEGGGKVSTFALADDAKLFEGTTKASPEVSREIATWLKNQGDAVIEAGRDSRSASDWQYAAMTGQVPPSSWPALQNLYARSQGYKGIRFRSVEGTGGAELADVVVMFEPKGLRVGVVPTVPEHLRPAFAAGEELSKKHESFRQSTGVGQDWDKEGVLRTPRLLDDAEGYVPHRVEQAQTRNAFPDVLPEGEAKPSMAQVLPASTKARKGGGEWLKDPVAQWERELSQIRPKAKVAQEMRNMRKYFEGNESMIASAVKYAPEESAKMVDLMKRKTGVEWVELPANLDERFQRLTGTPGQVVKGGTSTFVPKPIAERLVSLVKITDEKSAKNALQQFNEAFIRPSTRIWRTMVTLPNVAFHTTNAAGSFALGTLAHGLKAFNPKLQAGAASGALLAAIGKYGKKGAEAIPFELTSGKRVNLGDVLKMAEEDGIINVFDLRQGYEMTATKSTSMLGKLATEPLHAINKGLEVATSPLRTAAKGIDDYQHLTAYLGFLEDTTPAARAKAADLTAKFAGNYRRLGEGERKFLKEGFGFYSWMRFAFPHVVTQMLENPQRVAAYAKMRGYLERDSGAAGAAFPAGVPGYLKGKAVTAPLSMQPKKLQELLASGKVPEPGSHEFALMVMEDPINMGLAFIPLVENMTKGKQGDPRAESLANLLGPYAQAAIEIMTGRDLRTGEEIGGMGEHGKKFAKSFISRPKDAWANLIELYSGRPEALDLAMRYRAGRDFQGLEEPFVDEMRSIPSVPGAKLYPVKPLITGLRKQEEALDYHDARLQKRRKDLK